MAEIIARGLQARWLNGWLAAVGVTVLCPEVKLSWTDGPSPHAVFHVPEGVDLFELLTERWPSVESVNDFAITQRIDKPGGQDLSAERYRSAVSMSQSNVDDWSLSSFFTDLKKDRKAVNKTPKAGPFFVGAPKGVPIYDRLSKCLVKIQELDSLITVFRNSFDGHPVLQDNMGLGFNYRRVSSYVSTNLSENSTTGPTDNVVEVLTFFGISRFPLRGNGSRITQKGWSIGKSREQWIFTWPTWNDLLDAWGIDAYLDIFYSNQASQQFDFLSKKIFVNKLFTSVFQSVWFDPGSNDKLRGYASKRVL